MANESVMSDKGADAAVEANLDLLKTGRYSDFTIHCGEQTFQVHRAILHRKSSFLDALIGGKFRVCLICFDSDYPDRDQESSQQEATLSDIEPAVFAGVLEWLYTGNYPIPYREQQVVLECAGFSSTAPQNLRITHIRTITTTNTISDSLSSWDFLSHIGLYIAADRYMLPDLKQAARQNLRALIEFFNAEDLCANPDFQEALMMVYDIHNNFEDLKVLVAYATALVVDQEHQDWREWTGSGTTIGTLGWYLFMEDKCNIKIWLCFHCEQSQSFETDRYRHFNVRTPEGRFEEFCCACGLRGLCSYDCELVDAQARKPIAYCGDCILRNDFDWKCELTRGLDGMLRFSPTDYWSG